MTVSRGSRKRLRESNIDFGSDETTADGRSPARARATNRIPSSLRCDGSSCFLALGVGSDRNPEDASAGIVCRYFRWPSLVGHRPFSHEEGSPSGLPCLPWLSDFLELNVRTYVYNGAGRARRLVLLAPVQSAPRGRTRPALLPLELCSRAHAARIDTNSNLLLSIARRSGTKEAQFRYRHIRSQSD